MSLVLRAEDEPVASRRDYWQHVLHGLLAPLDLHLPTGSFRSRAWVSHLGATQLMDLTISEGAASRTPHLIKRSDPGFCKIDVLIEGRLSVTQGGRRAVLRSGDLVFVDLAQPCQWVNPTPARAIALSFPRSLLPMRDNDARQAAGVVLPGDRGPSGLVSALARQLVAAETRPDDGVRLSEALLDLLAVAMNRVLDRPVTSQLGQPALRTRIQAYVEQRLSDPDLSAQTIADAHHISRRTLYKLFEVEGIGVAGWIRQRRLAGCSRDLVDPALGDRPVSAIAARWGFINTAHFNRVFRAQYGMPPGEFRRHRTSITEHRSTC